jgi:hypothetical protein
LPEITEAVLRLQFERLEVKFKRMLDAIAECFDRGDCRWHELPSVRGPLAEMNQAVEKDWPQRNLNGR